MQKIHTQLYNRIKDMGFLDIEEYAKIKNDPYMDLCVEWVSMTGNPNELSLAHYGKMNGDLMRDPEMVFRIDHEAKTAMPFYWRNDYAYTERNAIDKETGKLKDAMVYELTDFAVMWLRNLKEQEFRYVK